MKGNEMRLRNAMLAGVSTLVLGLGVGTPEQAGAETISTAISGPHSWSEGDLSITGTGAISSGVSSTALYTSAPGGTLTNNGVISGVGGGIYNTGDIDRLTNGGTISGGATGTGIVNDGSIGTLTSNGIISGTNSGLSNNSAIDLLSNGGTINGVSTGISNVGSINALTNGGTIRGSNKGISNVSSIGVLSNSGSISGGSGISNTGSIGVLSNSGTISNISTISNSYTAISNTDGGSIGTLINSGVIAGSTGILNSGIGGGIGVLINSGLITGDAGPGIINDASIGTLTNEGTISKGSGMGIYNAHNGSIGTLTNGGTIISSYIGISNYGSIGTLTNGGAVGGGGGGGISNTGSIGALSNSGTISSGTGVGIKNASSGSIDRLSNEGTISGKGAGIRNDGGIGTLINDGAVSCTGDCADIYNTGSIGTLSNGGTISGGGIYNSGGIGVLRNSGTISSSYTAIGSDGSGSIGTLVNSGVIAGAISNTTANDLTISGGSGGAFGTLTGVGGSIGTITNTASNLVFASGNLVLDDHIDATGHMVTNSGATLRLNNTVTITGAYSQTGGGLISTATGNGASNGKLVVDGNASVSNSTITVSGGGLSAGQTFTVVDATGSNIGTYSGNTGAVAVTNGLGARVSTVGNDLVVTLVADDANTYSSFGAAAGGPAAAIGGTLDSIRKDSSPQAAEFQNTVLTAIDALPTSQRGKAMKQLAPNRSTPAAQMSRVATTAVLGAVEQRQQAAMAYDGMTGVAAGSDARDSVLWGQFLGGGARRDTNAEADGYHLRDLGLATGADRQFTPNALGGVAVSWLRAWTHGDDDSSGSSSIMDSYQLTFYGTYRLDRAFVDGQLGAGWNHFDQKRAIPFLGSTASASYDGQQYLARATLGYDVPVGAATVTPLASLRWLRSVTDAYNENGAGAADLSVDSQGVNGVTQDLGAKVAWNIPTGLGTLTPEARLAWVHDYTKSPIATSGLMGGQAFAVTAPRTEPDGVRIGLAATLAGDESLSFHAEYEGELRAQYQSHTGLVKALWGF